MHQTSGETGELTAAVVAGCDAAIVATDPDGRVLLWNAAATDLFGWEAEAVTGEVCPLSPRAENGDIESALERALDGERVHDIPVVVPDRDGEEHGLSATIAPLAGDGAPEGVVTTFTDSPRQRVGALERRIDHLEAFADTVAHDLRGPLDAAATSVELARDGGDEEHLDRAARCLDRIETIIEDLLALNRDDDRDPALTEVSLSAVVEDAWLALDRTDGHLLIDDDTSLTADRGQLRQLLANLLRNAVEHGSTNPASPTQRDAREHSATSGAERTPKAVIDAAHEGTEDVTVRVGALADRTGFYVADNGPGIPDDERELVFEYGYTTDEGGTGYGLTIVQRIAELHGWAIDVTESQYGGARFEVYENFSSNDA
jgi:PAS domain S-box-containing protein